MISRFARHKGITFFLIILLLVQTAPVSAFVLDEDEATAVQNVRFELVSDLVHIHYDLRGPVDRVHTVRLALYREGDRTFVYRPINVTGDVGTIVFPGLRRRITWDFTKEFPEGLSGDDYYFVVEAEALVEEGMDPLIWVGGGAALVGGIVLLLLLGGGDEGDGGGGVTPTGFPPAPGRPVQ